MSRIDENSGGMQESVTLPNPLNAKGVVTVQLHDAVTGKLVEEQTASNFISKGMETVYRAMMLSAFTRDLLGQGGSSDPLGNPLRKMLLTTANHDADPDNEVFIKGSTVGYAYTNANYIGSDIYRGSYNEAESFRGNDRVRIVIDFGTQAANGDVGSVYFTTQMNEKLLDVRGLPGTRVGVFKDSICVVKYKDRIYSLIRWGIGGSLHGGRDIEVYDESFNLLETVTIVPGTATSGRYCTGITFYNDYLYFTSEVNSYTRPDSTLSRVPISDLNGSKTVIIDEGSTSLRGVTYHPKLNRFVMLHAGNTVAIYNTTLDLLSTYPITKKDSIGAVVPGSGQSIARYEALFYDEESELLLNSWYSLNPETGEYTDKGGGLRLSGAFDQYVIENNTGTVYPRHGFTSRFKLPSPVTKTSSVTMKVTYDFLLPTIYD